MTFFDYFAGMWVLFLVAVIVYFAIDEFREWKKMLRKMILILAVILAMASPVLASDLMVASTVASGVTSCNFLGLPATIPATNVPVSNGVCSVDIQSLLGTAASYSVTQESCVAVTGAGIPAGKEVCSAASSPLSFSLPAVTVPAAVVPTLQ